mmetsp:Transcript_29555/g.49677  ORF Transcript_29555/g.49677 Transcript_29555/m.49677 type:complete len:459 (+) Transcript_29555:108-1484(+)|eukprot:CAMPEP_0198208274 /NCGR_PEP_ID=MMETSP1445-20131203/11652_1 /TAXON_ID=36898 /ORGANISM="Pyramimonas sp., Strain CCMP2087" /LENGTH=458 /DNA_ID=CAMNT_0043881609 /DNA_START=27 /DNA_END=1403 /DNA_ORIENTATION=-
MGRRRAGKRQAIQDGEEGQDGADCAPLNALRLNDEDADVLPVIAAHPTEAVFATAFGANVRVYDARSSKGFDLVEEKEAAKHIASVRCIAFAPSGHLMASAGDDKLVKVWDTQTWKCLRTWLSPKKISAIQFSPKGDWIFFANKFGEVLTASCSPENLAIEVDELKPGEGADLVLGHCCSIITDIVIPLDGRLIVTCDRDEKIRSSRMPTDPSDGSHEIAAFCLGHRSFVTRLAFVNSPSGELLLVSGGGDGTVRLWQPELGILLQTFDVSTAAPPSKEEEEEEGQETPTPTVMTVAASKAGVVAVGVQGYPDVLLLKVTEQNTLSLVQRVVISPAANIACLTFDHANQLWAMALAPRDPADQSEASDAPSGTVLLACASLAVDGTTAGQAQDIVSTPMAEALQVVPARLEAGDMTQRDYSSKATELGSVMPVKGLIKRKISEMEREGRKVGRNDKKK